MPAFMFFIQRRLKSIVKGILGFIQALIVFCAFVMPAESVAQSSELKAQGAALEKAVVAVESGSKRYEQKITFQEPALIRYS
jgi:hypothetical protein